jgi:tetratricopeptide (TPR) repeat protein
VALEPSLLMARLTLARLYLDMARAARAREELESALEQAPGRPEFLSLLGEAERKLGNPRRAVDLNRQALEAVADFTQARYYLGLALLDLRQHADAIRELRLVVESGENPVEANLALGTAYLEAGRVPDALTALNEAARVAPANPDVHIRLAQAHRSAKALGQADKALAVAEQHVKEGLAAVYSDRETDLLMETGLLRMAQGRLDAAAAAFQRVLTRNPQHPGARQQLGEVRKRLKEKMGKKPGTPS